MQNPLNMAALPDDPFRLFALDRLRADEYAALELALRRDADRFRESFLSNPDNDDLNTRTLHANSLHKWAESQSGRFALDQVVETSFQTLCSYIGYGAPGHDNRHILFKDPVEALRHLCEEGGDMSGYRPWLLVASLWHDSGRLLEEHFNRIKDADCPDTINHALLSFALTRAFLQKIPGIMRPPRALQDHILYAVLAHSGENAQTFIGWATQRADRFEILGGEGITRILGYDVGVETMRIYPDYDLSPHSLPPNNRIRSGIELIDYFLRNMRSNIDTAPASPGDREGGLKAQTVALLHHIVPEADRAVLFHPEITVYEQGGSYTDRGRKPLLPAPVWQAAKTYAASFHTAEVRAHEGTDKAGDRDITERFFELIHDPANHGLTPSQTHDLKTSIAHLSPQRKQALDTGLALLQAECRRDDAADLAFLARTARKSYRPGITALASRIAGRFGHVTHAQPGRMNEMPCKTDKIEARPA